MGMGKALDVGHGEEAGFWLQQAAEKESPSLLYTPASLAVRGRRLMRR